MADFLLYQRKRFILLMKDIKSIDINHFPKAGLDISKGIYINEKIIISCRSSKHLPYAIPDGPFYCFGANIQRIICGEARVMINMEIYDVRRGDIILVPKGSIFEYIWTSEEYDYQLVIFDIETEVHDAGRKITLDEANFRRTSLYLDLLWETVKSDGYREYVLREICETFVLDIIQLSVMQQKENGNEDSVEVQKNTFLHKFLMLINKHIKEERTLDYYADKLHISPHYLSARIKKDSGRTFTQWGDYALIQKIKLELHYTNKRITDISYDFHFENPSDFSRYFKRNTGMTPLEYRKSIKE